MGSYRKGDYRPNLFNRPPRDKKYVCSCSFGKDSLATLLLALENGEPLDSIVYVEVMFDLERGISGENPEHIAWIEAVAKPKLREMGVEVIHLRSDKDYVGLFHTNIESGPRKGMLRGFPIANKCQIQKECKLSPINRWLQNGYFNDGYDVVEYVGIAVDEFERMDSLDVSSSPRITKESLLIKYKYNETMALLKCHEYGLLSPIYTNGFSRNGCWFCPNQSVDSFSRFRANHYDLWYELKKLSKTQNMCSNIFKYDKTFDEIEDKVKQYYDSHHKYM